MGRRACCEKIGLKKGPWTAEEDQKLRAFIHTYDTKYCWRAVPKLAGLLRCGKSCRLRWANYLRPDLKNDILSEKEEKLVIYLRSQFGNKWSQIASHLPGRTDNYIKNYWHNHIKKRLNQIDSNAHKPLFPDPRATDHRNTSQQRAEESSEEMDDQDKGREIDETLLLEDSITREDDNDDMAKEDLAIDTGFSIDDIPLIDDHEILVSHCVHLPSNNSSLSSSFPTPSASTATSPSTINMTVEKVNSLPYWHSNDQCNNSNGMVHSYEDNFTDWDHWFFNGIDIHN